RLHVVAAHRTWGVAEGLQVDGSPDAARVERGAAYDRHGRALVLAAATEISLPPALAAAPGPVELVLTERDGRPAVRFLASSAVRPGTDVPLAAFAVDAEGLGAPDLTVRRSARPLSGARLGAGTAVVDVDPEEPDGTRTFVDTSRAGF